MLHFNNVILQDTGRVSYGREGKREGEREEKRKGGREKAEEGLKSEPMVGKSRWDYGDLK